MKLINNLTNAKPIKYIRKENKHEIKTNYSASIRVTSEINRLSHCIILLKM